MLTREQLGRAVRQAWVEYCNQTGDTKPSHLAPWEELSEWERAADICIGAAVAAATVHDISTNELPSWFPQDDNP